MLIDWGIPTWLIKKTHNGRDKMVAEATIREQSEKETLLLSILMHHPWTILELGAVRWLGALSDHSGSCPNGRGSDPEALLHRRTSSEVGLFRTSLYAAWTGPGVTLNHSLFEQVRSKQSRTTLRLVQSDQCVVCPLQSEFDRHDHIRVGNLTDLRAYLY